MLQQWFTDLFVLNFNQISQFKSTLKSILDNYTLKPRKNSFELNNNKCNLVHDNYLLLLFGVI